MALSSEKPVHSTILGGLRIPVAVFDPCGVRIWAMEGTRGMIRHLRNLTSAAVLAAAFCAFSAEHGLGSYTRAAAACLPPNRVRLVPPAERRANPGHPCSERHQGRNVYRPRAPDRSSWPGRRNPSGTPASGPGAAPDIRGASTIRGAEVRSIQYAPPFGLFAHVTVQPRSQSTLLRQRFRGASSPLPLRFARATLFAAPTGLRVSSSGLPTGAGLRSTS